MGLDMYLDKRHYVQQWEHIPDEKQFHVTVTRGGEAYTPVKSERVSYVVEQVAYWRKANAIHHWFVDNVQGNEDDCKAHWVSAEQLKELLTVVNLVLEDPERGEDMLPTEAGFFFGSTEYDESYRLDLEDTKQQLESLLAEDGAEEADYYYRASW
jgi:hypothetical protein